MRNVSKKYAGNFLKGKIKSRKTSRFVLTDVRDLYELLLQKEALENRLQQQQQLQGQQHEIVRKANRSPSLRLRFGRRADPLLTVRTLLHNLTACWKLLFTLTRHSIPHNFTPLTFRYKAPEPLRIQVFWQLPL